MSLPIVINYPALSRSEAGARVQALIFGLCTFAIDAELAETATV
jgi:hypothetical protein